MTSGLTSRLIHSCTITRKAQDQKLSFTQGSAVFTAAKVIEGSTSKATGTVKTVTLVSGAWTGTAAGYLILSGASGTFQAGETIAETTGTTPGTAKAGGAATLETDELGTSITTDLIQSGVKCRFISLNTNVAQGFTDQGESGRFILKIPLLFLAAGTDVLEGDLITTTASGWSGKTYEVSMVDLKTEFNSSTIDHIEAQLKSLEKQEAE
jgi:hypothetical protein